MGCLPSRALEIDQLESVPIMQLETNQGQGQLQKLHHL